MGFGERKILAVTSFTSVSLSFLKAEINMYNIMCDLRFVWALCPKRTIFHEDIIRNPARPVPLNRGQLAVNATSKCNYFSLSAGRLIIYKDYIHQSAVTLKPPA